MDNLYVIIKEQFPEVIEHQYPAFVAFVQAYYKWVEQQSLGRIEDVVDVDNTPERFVEYFRRYLDVDGIYTDVLPFDTKYIKTIKQIYAAKGSEQALVFLLKTVYNASSDTKIIYPRDSILRASDGVWAQERFITVSTAFGQLPQSINVLVLEYGSSEERINITRYEIVDETLVRFYFKTNTTVSIQLNQNVKILQNNVVVYRGRVVLSPHSLIVENGGKNWQLGQVITVPGTVRDTIARVSEIGIDGKIKRLEILEYGYNHNQSSTLIVSPFPIRPLVATYDYQFDENTKTHTLIINDFIDGVSDDVEGASSAVSLSSYFLEQYDSEVYTAHTVFKITTFDSSRTSFDKDIDLTLEEWLLSRATIRYQFDVATSTKGRWANSRGLISDSYIRLQDNYYYQQYSYVVESNLLRSKYETMLNNIHVSGNKSFSTYLTSESLNLDFNITTEIPFKWINVSDVSTADDSLEKSITKPVDEILTNTDNAFIDFTKYTSTDVESTETINNISLDKQFVDTSTVEEIVSKETLKQLENSVTAVQVDENTSFELEDFFAEQYDVYADPLSLQAELS